MEGLNGGEDMEEWEGTGQYTSFSVPIFISIFMAKWWKYGRYENGI